MRERWEMREAGARLGAADGLLEALVHRGPAHRALVHALPPSAPPARAHGVAKDATGTRRQGKLHGPDGTYDAGHQNTLYTHSAKLYVCWYVLQYVTSYVPSKEVTHVRTYCVSIALARCECAAQAGRGGGGGAPAPTPAAGRCGGGPRRYGRWCGASRAAPAGTSPRPGHPHRPGATPTVTAGEGQARGPGAGEGSEGGEGGEGVAGRGRVAGAADRPAVVDEADVGVVHHREAPLRTCATL
jgi:hypothetical protein